MKKSIIAGGLSAMLLASAALYAAPGAGTGKLAIDADGNGAVSKAESLAAADQRFAKMDANSDGQVDAADREAKVKQHFAELDKDGNGSVSEAEFLADHQERAAKKAAWADNKGQAGEPGKDGRGKHRGGRGGHGGGHGMGMKNADANGDKVITQAEFRTAAEARFVKSDANNDGSISADEMKAGKGMRRGPGDRNAPPPPADEDS